jgi:hypothetical protein
MTIKAIETVYKGYRFRSRLEARWAVFFDSLGVEWAYEPEGFETSNGYRYLPDFRIQLGQTTYWVEVKGDPNWLKEDFDTIFDIHDFGGILPEFSENGEKDEIPNGLILLGEIPSPSFGLMFVPVIGHRKGVNLYWRAFTTSGLVKLEQIAKFFLNINRDENCLGNLYAEENLDFQTKIVNSPRAYAGNAIEKALIAARSSRFEHGERG